MDAVRISDNSLVALKKIRKEFNPHELEVVQYLTSESVRADPRNSTVPIVEVLAVPDDSEVVLIVMPLLRPCNDPAWDTIGEVVSFISQILQVSVADASIFMTTSVI